MALAWGRALGRGLALCSASKPRLMLGSDPAVLEQVSRDVELREEFVSPEEEEALLRELEPFLKRLRYQREHWDQAIHAYRETERSRWSKEGEAILQRVRDAAFPPGTPQLSMVHVLDLEKEGFIRAHVDSVKFCGDTIAGLCLLSAGVMRLVSEEDKVSQVDLLLQRRCLYILRGTARYTFSHQVLADKESFFAGQRVPRGRRISVICRNLPSPPG